jgi:hypothetical protein
MNVAAQRDDAAGRVRHHVGVAQTHNAIVVGLHERFIEHLCRTANVEGTHGELGARFTDRLGRNNADSLAKVDRRTTGQITAVAAGTHPKRVSQVSTERMRNSWIFASSIFSTSSSVISRPTG